MSRARRLWLVAHRYLGLLLGALFVLLGLTGSVLVFYQELDEWLNPDLLTVQRREKARSLDEIVNAARLKFPQWRGPTAIRLPRTPESAVRLEFEAVGGAPMEVAVDPYTARVQGQRHTERHLIAIIYSLHYRLLLDQGIGMTLVGIAGILMVLSSVSGLELWWPRWRQLRSALTIQWSGSLKRINFDLHRTSGFWSAAVLVVVAITGSVMCFYDYVQAVVEFTLPTTPLPAAVSRVVDGKPDVSLHRIVDVAHARFPNATAKYLSLPLKADEPYIARLRQPGEVRRSSGDTVVWVDRYAGEILAVRDPLRSRSGDQFMDWQFPLHNGEAFGLFGRITVCLSGLVPALLYASGIAIWWKKSKGQARAARLKKDRERQS